MRSESKFFIGIGLVTLILVVGGVLLLSKQKSTTDQTKEADQTVLYKNVRHAIGDANAPVKIVEFGDFQCPACANAEPIMKKAVEQNSSKVYFVFRHYPLTFHQNAKPAAQATEAAANQNKFWEMHHMIYQNQKEWSEKSNAREIFETYAQNLNLNIEKYKDDFNKASATIEEDYADGNRIGIESTPTFFINGKKYPGVIPENTLEEIIKQTSASS